MALRHLFRQASSCAQALRSVGLPVVASSLKPTLHHFSALVTSNVTSKSAFAAVPWFGALAAAAAWTPVALASSSEERSFIMIKPDGVHRGLISDIIKRFEQKGYKLVGIKILVPTEDVAGRHYADLSERPFFPKLVKFLASGPVVAMVWEGKEVIKYGRTIIGATNPLASAPGTVRGDYAVDVGRNVIHGSDSVESAQKEIALWFDPSELTHWEPVASTWIYE